MACLKNSRSTCYRVIVAMLSVTVLLNLTGCPWFDSDDDGPSETVTTTLPESSFSASIQTGQAPLSVDFIDTSSNGSSAITSWQWDFGDGNSSNERNPQHLYEEPGVYDVSLTVISEDGEDTSTQLDHVTVYGADIPVTFAVVDTNGLLLDDITFESSTYQIAPTSKGINGFTVSVKPSDDEGVIKISKSGYLRQLVHFEGILNPEHRSVTLIERGDPIPFNGMTGSTLQTTHGISVDIPAESLVDSNGSVVLGEISAYVTPIDTSDRIALNAFPGSFFGALDENTPVDEQEQLFSYGVVDITFHDNQSGEELQLRDGFEAQLKLPLFSNKNVNGEDLEPGDVIPIWYLDEDTGIWLRVNDGIVVENPLAPHGLSLLGSTSHFTTFNSDINPPGLGRRDNGSGGGNGGSGNGTSFCTLNLDMLGGEVGETYTYVLRYFLAGLPPSARTRLWRYNGSPLSHSIIRGYMINVQAISPDGESASEVVSCGSNDIVEALFDFGNSEPEFRYFEPTARPVFTKTGLISRYEIITNTIQVGAEFVGTDAITITSDILDQPLILGRNIYRDITYSINDASPVSFTATLSDESGDIVVEQTKTVEFIDSQAPIPGITVAFYDSDLFATIIEWINWQGADEYRIYYLGEDLTAPGSLESSGTIDHRFSRQVRQINQELTGYLRIEFVNQYGITEEYIRISETPCPIGTDLCTPSQTR